MNKRVLSGLAALAACTGAWAEPSVTVFGFLEAQVGRQTQNAPGTQLYDMGGSRLGFKGDEDLGGGLKASFYLEHRLNPDYGTVGGGASFWKGGAWVCQATGRRVRWVLDAGALERRYGDADPPTLPTGSIPPPAL